MTTIYKLTRDLSGERDLIHLSTDRKLLADLMRVDINRWTVPVTYTIEITLEFDNLFTEGKAIGRVSAFREAAEFFDNYADTFPVHSIQQPAFRYACVKLFALMEQEIGK